MTIKSPQQTAILAGAIGLAWAVFGGLRFDQGLDLVSQGLWVLGASFEAGGSPVHGVIDTGDGPLPYLLLGTWMRLFGESFIAAARVQMVLHVAIAVCTVIWTRRHGPWAVALGQLALLAAAPLPFPAAWAFLSLLLGATLPERARPAMVCGFLAAGLVTLDSAWFLVAAFCAALLHRRAIRSLANGFALGVATILVQALASGSVGPTLVNAFAGPWTGPAGYEFGRVFTTLVSGAWLHLPFAGLATGEIPGPTWPAHEILRSTGLRLLGGWTLASPLLLWWKLRNAPASWIATAAALLLLMRGDVPGIVIAGAVCGLAWANACSRDLRPALAVMTLALLVPAAENSWLAARSGRPTLERWESERVGVRLTPARSASLQTAVRELHLHADQPALVWPDLPGLHFLLDSRPVVPELRPGRDARTAEALRASPAPVVLIAPSRDLLPQHLERSHPETSTELRRNYRLRGAMPAGGLNLRAFQRGGSEDDPLAARLPRIESIVANDVQELSPALRNDLAIGQSFRIEDDDLRGFAIRLVTTSDSVNVRLRARLWEKPGSEYNSLLAARTLEIVARRDQPMHWVNFPVTDTAGRNLALVFEAMETPLGEVRFAWNEDATLGDVYPYGSAMLDLEEVDADLVILVY
jgi:hypothetical protein